MGQRVAQAHRGVPPRGPQSGQEPPVGDDTEAPDGPTSLTIDGLADHYHTGDPVELTAVPDAETDLDHYHWYTRDSAQDDWAAADGGDGDSYTGTAEIDGQQIQAKLYGDDHEVVAESDPVTVHIDDHDDEDPVRTTLTVEGLADSYTPGDQVELTAIQDPETGLDHYHWFTRATPDSAWELAGDAGSGSTYTFEAVAEADGFQIQSRLYDDDHTTVASSEPVTLRVAADDDAPGGGTPGDGPADAPASGGNTGGDPAGSGGDASDEQCFPVEVERDTAADPGGQPGAPLVLDHGHIDAFDVSVTDGDLALLLKEDVTGSQVTHQPEDVVLHVKEDAFTGDIPDAYPGGPSGYLLPLTQDHNLIWPGWDTGGVAGSGYTDVEIDITAVNGPGEVYLYSTDTFGGVVSLLTDGSHELPGTIREERPAHTHAQWTFSAAGTYTLTAQAEATNPDSGNSLTSDTATYTVTVGDSAEGPAPQHATGAETVSTVTTVGRTAAGEDCELPLAAGGDGNLASTGSSQLPLLAGLTAALLAVGAAVLALVRKRRPADSPAAAA